MEDVVARVMRQWRDVRPDLDLGPMGVIGRLTRCHLLLQHAEDTPLARLGLTRPEFDVLNALRRIGGEATPSRLARETFSSGAAVTKRLRALEDRGLIGRRADPRDRRVSHVSLTDAGGALIDEVLPAQLEYESELLSALDAPDRERLAEDLARLLLVLENRLGGP